MRILNNTKVSVFEVFYFLCMLLYAGYASVFARDIGFWGQSGNTFALIITILFAVVERVKFTSRYLTVIGIFVIYTIFNFIGNGYTSFGFLVKWLTLFTIAYVICDAFKERFFPLYETCLVLLCLIGLGFWFFFLTIPEQLVSFMQQHEFSAPFNETRPTVNMMVYTVNTRLSYEDFGEFQFFRRNAGFAWEPGAFACYICFAIYCNVLRRGFEFRKNTPLVIFLIALLSTESTTGFFIVIAFYLVGLLISQKKSKYLIVIGPLLAVAFFGLPFVSAKFMREVSMVDQINLADTAGGGYGRIFSLRIALMEFINNPILGNGGSNNTLMHQMGYDISIFSGIGNLMSDFGIFMTAGFFYLVAKSAQIINIQYDSIYGYLLWIPLMGLMISYNVWNTPIVMFFWLYGFFREKTIIKSHG